MLAGAPQARATQGIALRLEPAPKVQVGDEVGMLAAECLVRRIRLCRHLQGALTRIFHRERCHHDQRVGQAAEAPRLDQHARQIRIDGQSRHDPAVGCQSALV